jgi:NAD(P)-dependent dehydrogenase (short-subunit alcohol dehydrogenase family)
MTLKIVNAEGTRAIGVRLDVREADSALEVASVTTREFGRIDALVNNAALYGALRGGRFDLIAETDWDAAMAVNA